MKSIIISVLLIASILSQTPVWKKPPVYADNVQINLKTYNTENNRIRTSLDKNIVTKKALIVEGNKHNSNLKKVAGYVDAWTGDIQATQKAVSQFTEDAKLTRKQWKDVKVTQAPLKDGGVVVTKDKKLLGGPVSIGKLGGPVSIGKLGGPVSIGKLGGPVSIGKKVLGGPDSIPPFLKNLKNVKKGVKIVVKKSGKKGDKKVVKKGGKAVVKIAVKKGGKAVANKAVKKATKKLVVKKTGKKGGKRVVKKADKKGAKKVVKKAGKKGAEKASKKNVAKKAEAKKRVLTKGSKKWVAKKAGAKKAGPKKAAAKKAGVKKRVLTKVTKGSKKWVAKKAGAKKAGAKKAEAKKRVLTKRGKRWGVKKADPKKGGNKKAGNKKAGNKKAGNKKAGNKKSEAKKRVVTKVTKGSKRWGVKNPGPKKAGNKKSEAKKRVLTKVTKGGKKWAAKKAAAKKAAIKKAEADEEQDDDDDDEDDLGIIRRLQAVVPKTSTKTLESVNAQYLSQVTELEKNVNTVIIQIRKVYAAAAKDDSDAASLQAKQNKTMADLKTFLVHILEYVRWTQRTMKNYAKLFHTRPSNVFKVKTAKLVKKIKAAL